MCGIVGQVSQKGRCNPEILRIMRDSMLHRGPDDAGEWYSPDFRVGVAHRRLSIIDLSPAGHQPMIDASNQLIIIFNGEIYNYRELRRVLEAKGHSFRTASDTEVILEAYRAWGTDCLTHLNGMFAFGLYDSTARRLFLARDRAGEKPLYYRNTPGKLIFASELKALMADPAYPRQLNLEALNFYLAYGYVPGEMCILNGVRKLGQAQAMTYELETDSLHIWQYWHLPEPVAERFTSAEELTEELEALLEDAVRRQLVADVPVGILLSGGMDSSLVTAMVARSSSTPVRTFTISFPGYGVLDEGPFARIIAEHFGTLHTELVGEPTTVEFLPALARQFDEPIADHAIVPTYLISHLIHQSVKVALSGDGGDELFGGYPHYSWILWEERLRKLIPSLLRNRLGTVAAHILPVGLRGRNYVIGFAGDISLSIAHINLYFDQQSRYRLLSPVIGDHMLTSNPEEYRALLCQSDHNPIRQATESDFKTTLVDGYLVKVDRASMLNSLEVRAPFLDYRIIEFAFSRVPDFLKVTEWERKVLLRRLVRRILPLGFDLKRKQGFTMPLASWFDGGWGLYMESVLRESDPAIFDQRMIQSLIQGQHHGYANTNRLFALTMFELWRREYRVSLSD